ncbi:AraC-like DNA-binding protein [Gracilibacillus halotolerans]|uniref:AraC-like DNA-binding protein n=1 Tax=Gracilibacillus halotolerans TaxID=74386 RepID=A0A841RKW0_9BACI|nr:AraC family transcriptional regulator [Gracilibacillus halotolerans]MBB6512507.1 AraC-like DNA-binding protein [Gracilibacillus halotolerans]
MKHIINWSSTAIPMIHEIGYMSDPVGHLTHPDRFMEDWNVFVLVTNGKLNIIEDGTNYMVEAGQFLFLKQGVHHWGKEKYMKNSAWYYIHFSGDVPSHANEREEYSPFRHTSLVPKSAYETNLTLPKYGSLRQKNYFTTKLQDILESFQSTNSLRLLLAGMKFYEVLLDIYTEKLEEDSNRSRHRTISKLMELFHANEHKLSSSEISTALNMNYSYLSKQFKEHTGKSIIHYQNEILIEKAIQIFRKENDNISEVSDRLGFSNPFYFSRVFKKVTGVSPSMYLKHIYKN